MLSDTGRPDPATPKICGVDQAVIERFLELIRDNYTKADRASFFLEEVAGKTHTLATANLRDVLSHLATTLSPDTLPEEWDAQLASAEEHFRRAIQEPYQIALGNLREKFNTVHSEYLKIYPKITRLQPRGLFASAPRAEAIQTQLRRIAELASEGRAAKRRNRIDSKWDDGVASCIEAYNELELLTTSLSTHVHEFTAMRDGSQGKYLSIVGVLLAIVFFAVSTVLVLSPNFTSSVQKMLGLLPSTPAHDSTPVPKQ